mmetsp:Transcript_4426/g.9165  ORF Transcript_4426/g.9165 Transcript_4426/m.9165 type:complete len:349 (+) Transcript_4426:4744-5790(+)
MQEKKGEKPRPPNIRLGDRHHFHQFFLSQFLFTCHVGNHGRHRVEQPQRDEQGGKVGNIGKESFVFIFRCGELDEACPVACHGVSLFGARGVQDVISHETLKGQDAIVEILTGTRILQQTQRRHAAVFIFGATGVVLGKGVKVLIGRWCGPRRGTGFFFEIVKVCRILPQTIHKLVGVVSFKDDRHGHFWVVTGTVIGIFDVIFQCFFRVHNLHKVVTKLNGLGIIECRICLINPGPKVSRPLHASLVRPGDGQGQVFTIFGGILPDVFALAMITLDDGYHPIKGRHGHARNAHFIKLKLLVHKVKVPLLTFTEAFDLHGLDVIVKGQGNVGPIIVWVLRRFQFGCLI